MNCFAILLDVFVALFFSIGVIYFLREALSLMTKNKTKTKAVILLKLSEDRTKAVGELISISNFYHDALASRYIEKIIALDPADTLEAEKDNLAKALHIPLEFQKNFTEDK